ncbi:hypothetical protein ABBQ32_008736 [Trebouxia sp. C0010 RCD-2024]
MLQRVHYAFFGVLMFACFIVAIARFHSSGAAAARSFTQSPLTKCLKFARYIPSKWESDWLQLSVEREIAICDLVNKERSNSELWLSGVLHPDQLIFPQSKNRGDVIDSVWSLYKYHDTCAPKAKVIYVPIEPAVGLLRNPLAAPCNTGSEALNVDDRDYLYLAPPDLTNDYPGRKLLFDLGTGTSFSSSLSWFVEAYSNKGVEFDEIWSWEAAETGPHEYWKSVPDEYVSKLHFYNTYASDEAGPAAPLGILHRTFQQGDFVVIKLDIDNEMLESTIMQQLIHVHHMIGELFFEKHFDAVEMRPYFGSLTTSYNDTLQMFNKYRKLGIRLHYWP